MAHLYEERVALAELDTKLAAARHALRDARAAVDAAKRASGADGASDMWLMQVEMQVGDALRALERAPFEPAAPPAARPDAG